MVVKRKPAEIRDVKLILKIETTMCFMAGTSVGIMLGDLH